MIVGPAALKDLTDFADFERYAKALVASRDVDPVYDLIPQILQKEGFQPEWFIFVYVAFYSLDSAVRVCRQIPDVASYTENRFVERCRGFRRFGVERRGVQRDLRRMLEAFTTFAGDLPVIRETLPSRDHETFRADLRNLPLVGDWAAFKLTELFEKALGYRNLSPTDMGIASRDPNSTRGPQGGIHFLYGKPPAGGYKASQVVPEWERLGLRLAARWGFDLGEVETCLCKWAKVCKGQYFIGHDIYEFNHLKHLWPERAFRELMTAAGFPIGIWTPEMPSLTKAKRAYKDRRVLINEHYGRP